MSLLQKIPRRPEFKSRISKDTEMRKNGSRHNKENRTTGTGEATTDNCVSITVF